MTRMDRWFWLASMVLGAALMLGCGKQRADVVRDNKPAFDAWRAELKEIARTLPAPGSVQLVKADKLTPAPVYVSELNEKCDSANLDAVMAEQLQDTDPSPDIDVAHSQRLIQALERTHPKASPLIGVDSDGFLAAQFARALRVRYLAVVRVVSFNPPVIRDNKFSGGKLQGEVMVVDVPSKKMVASAPFVVEPGDNVHFHYDPRHKDLKEAAREYVEADVTEAAQKEVKRIVEQTAGATWLDEH